MPKAQEPQIVWIPPELQPYDYAPICKACGQPATNLKINENGRWYAECNRHPARPSLQRWPVLYKWMF